MKTLRALFSGIVLASVLSSAAEAANFTVNTTTDAVDAAPGDGTCASAAGECTLRAAIQETNASSGGDTINVPPGLYRFTVSGTGEDGAAMGDMDITDTTGFLTIFGSGAAATVVDANSLDRVFDVIGSADVDFWDLTIQGGRPPGSNPGGGIRHGDGFLNLRRVVLRDNGARDGGAVITGTGSTVIMQRCAVVDNTASSLGGGIQARNGVNITNSTFSGNSANQGGGLWCGGAACSVRHVTITANDAVSGGGIYSDVVSTSMVNSIIAVNNSGGDCAGATNSQGSNIDGDNSCGLGAAGDQPSTNPLLGPLQDNGGGTLTHAIPLASPAVDTAAWGSCLSPDQRGVGRPIDGDGDTWSDCDIGAYEFDPAGLPVADLSLSKTVDSGTPDVGSNVVFTLTVSNAGPADATGVSVEDILPAGYTWVSDDSAGAYNTGTGVWTIGNLAAAGSATLNITVTVNGAGPYDNAAQVLTANETDPDSIPGNGTTNGEDDEDSASTTPAAPIDLSLSKTVDNATPDVGSNVVFTLTVSNAGPSDATGVSVEDILPAGYTWVSDDSAGAYNTGTGVWTIGNLAAAGSATLNITVSINATGPYDNAAQVLTANESDLDSTPGNGTTNGEDDEDSASTTPGAVADLSLSKTVDNGTPSVGSNVVFTVTVSNAGPSDATGVSVEDILPAGYTWVSDDSTGAYNTGSGLWTIGNLAAGGSATINITVSVNAAGPYDNAAQVLTANENDLDSTPGNGTTNGEDDEDSASTTPGAVVDLSLSKTVDNATPDVGNNVVFTLTVNNAGPSDATGVTVEDILPAGYSWVSDDSAGAYNTGTGVWTIGNLGAAGSATINITVSVNAAGPYDNAAQVLTANENDLDSTPGNGTTNGEDDEDSVSTTPAALIDLSLSKTVDNATPDVGNNVVFTLTVANAGPSDATGVTVEDILPAGYSWVSDDSAGAYNPGSGLWTIGNVGASGSATLNITVSVNAAGPYDNAAQVLTANENDLDSTPGNGTTNGEDDEDSVSTTPAALIDLSLSKTVDNATPSVGSNVVFTLTVSNAGPSDATGVSVEDILPAGYTWVSDDSAGAYNTGSGLWTIGNLAAAGSATLNITVSVNATGPYDNAAQVLTANENDLDSTPGNGTTNGEDDEDSASTTPAALIDLSLSKTVDNGTPSVGLNVVFTLTVNNAGPSDATGVTVEDILPAGYTWVSDDSAGAYNTGTGVWTIGNLAAAGSTTINITVSVNATGPYDNAAQVLTANESDLDSTPGNGTTNGEDDEDSASTTPAALIDLSLSKTVDNGTPSVGSNVAFTLTVSNAGPSDATGVSVEDILPAGYTWVSDDSAGAYNPGSGLWTIGNLGAGGLATINITVSVNATGPYDNAAQVLTANESDLDSTPGNGTTNGEDDEDSASTTPAALIDLSLSKTVDNATPDVGSNVTFTLTVGNAGPSDATGVSVEDVLPAGYTWVSDDSAGAYNTGTGVWTIGNLGAAGSATLNITVSVNAAGPYDNAAQVLTANENDLDSTPGNGTTNGEDDEDSVSTTPAALIDLSLSKTVDNGTPSVGSNVVFTLTVSNAGPSDATGVSVEDVLPAGYTWVSDDSAGAYNTGSGLWTIGNLAASGSTTINIAVSVNAAGPYDNAAQVLTANENDLDSTPGNGTTNGEDDEDSASTTPAALIDLSLSKTVDNGTPDVGSNVTFTLTVSNAGPSDATGVSVEDVLPAGYTWVSDDSAGAYNTGSGLWTIGNLAAAGSATLNITVSVNATGPYDNAAQVLTANENDLDSTPGNGTTNGEDDEDSVSTTPAALIDLSLSKTVDNGTPSVGSNVVFTLSVANAGPSDATGVSVEDVLPAGYTWVSDDSAGAYNTGSGLWTIGNLAAAGSATLNITVSVNATGPYDNAAQVLTANESDLDSTPGNGTTNGEDDEDSVSTTPAALIDLSLSKTVDNGTPSVGSNVVFTLTVSNAGPSDATGVSVEDILPAGYTWVSDDSAGAYNPGSGLWTIGNLGAAGSATLNITVSVNAAGPYDNAAQVLTANENDVDSTPGNGTTNGEDDEDSVSTTPAALIDLSLSKTVDNGTPDVGSNVTFTLTVSNAGPSDATGVSVEDVLPAGYTWVSDDSAGAYNTGSGLWTIGNLAASGSATINITVSVNATGPYDNAAQVLTANENDLDSTPGNGTTNGEDDEDSISTTPGAVVDLSLSKTVDNATPDVGNNVVFTLTVGNAGPSDATGVSVEDVLPAGYTWVSDDSAGAYNTGSGVWTIGNLGAAGSATLNLTVSVNATGPYDNAAQVLTANENDLDSTPGNGTTNGEDDEDSVSTIPGAMIDLSLSKTVDNGMPSVGSNVVFTLTVGNAGPSDATGVTVEDILPAGYSWVSDDSAGAYNPGSGLWTIGNLGAAGSTTINITVSVNAAGPYDNAAQVLTANESDLDSTPGNGTTNGEDDEASATTTPGAVADLSLTKTVDNATPDVGNNVTFTLTVSNAGPSDASGVTVEDILPAGYTWVSDDSAGAYNTGSGLWTIGNLGASGSTTINITVSVNATGPYDNAAQVLTANETDLDSTPGNGTTNGEDDEDSASTTPAALADLSLTKTVDNATPDVGTNITFTLTVSNAGPSDATNVQVIDALPAGCSFVTASGDGAFVGSSGVWTVGTVPAGSSRLMNITTTVNASGPYTNIAEVMAADQTDPDSTPNNRVTTEDDYALRSTTPNGTPQNVVLLTKKATRSQIVMGESAGYVLTAQNTTANALATLIVEDFLPPGFKLVTDSVFLVRAGVDGQLGTDDDTRTPLEATASRPVQLGPIDLAVDEIVKILYLAQTGAGARLGDNENTARPVQNNVPVGNQASAVVTLLGDPILDQATIIGKVFRDRNENGSQDPGEDGVPGAMVVLDDGTYALTDLHGRYHFPNVNPGQRMVKINLHSLPVGAFATYKNSRILWTTGGLMMKANFPVHWQDHTDRIGRPEIHGLNVTKDLKESPVEIVGNADALAVLVSGKLLDISTSDVFLETHDLDQVIWLKGDKLQGPVRFVTLTEPEAQIDSWTLTIRDGQESVVRVLEGRGSPPEFVEWDGRAETGRLVEAGEIYQYQLETLGVTDGEQATSPWRLFGVNRETVLSLQLTGGAFEFNRHELSAGAKEILRQAAEQLAGYPEEKILITGHTDAVGSQQYNMGLSRRRAEAARSYLVDTLRFPASRITLKGYGEERPIAPNELAEGRALNRRVDIEADLEQVESADILDSYRTEGVVEVNGHRLAVGEKGRFTGQVPASGEDVLDIQVTGQHGVSARTRIELPAIEIVQPPLNSALLAFGASSHGCAAAAPASDGSTGPEAPVAVTCQLQGRTQPGNSIELNGEPLMLSPDGQFTADLTASLGKTTHGLIAHNAAGYTRITNLEITVTDRGPDGGFHVVAEAIPNLAVQLPPPRVRLPQAQWELKGTTDPGNRVTANGESLKVQPDGSFSQVLPLPYGKSRLVVKVVDPQGRSGQIERELEVARTQLFLLAFFDGKYGEMTQEGLVQPSGADEQSEYYSEGRAAFYLKGVIAGKYLISSSLDTGTNEFGELFDDFNESETRYLLANLDPDRFYPIYGDSSTVVFDAQSSGKFYLAVESDHLDALVGNFPVSFTDTELATYNRTLYGARVAYQSVSRTRFGEPDTEVVVFGADVRQAHIRDELRSTGASLYYLSHQDVVMGSEEVQLVIRDKNTNLQLSRKRMVQNIDYVIKYPEGRIMFQRPIPMVGEDTSLVNQEVLAGHPVFVQVDYETRLDSLEKTAAGARARQHLGDRVAVGITYVDDEATSGTYELSGFDAEVRIAGNSRILGEYADSTGADAIAFVSTDGGVTFTPVPASGLETGSAWKVAAELDVGEWFGKPDRYQVSAYYKELEPGFSSSGNLQEQGTEKTGVHSTLRVSEKDSIHIRYSSEERTGLLAPGVAASTDRTSLQWNRHHDRWGLSAEIFDEAAEDMNGTELRNAQLAAARLQWRATAKLTTGFEYQYTLDGPDNDQATVDLEYQATKIVGLTLRQTEGDLGRATQAGLLVQMDDKQLYLTQRVADDSVGHRQATALGARAPLGPSSHVYSEYLWQDDSRGERVMSVFGVQRSWDFAPGLKFLLTGEMSDMETGGAQTRRTSGATSILYTNDLGLRLVNRNVLFFDRGSKDLDQFLTFNQIDYQFSTDWSVFGKYRYSKTEDPELDQVEARLEDRSVGLAYRPVRHDRFNLIAVYSRLLDKRPPGARDQETVSRVRDVLSLETNYEFSPRLEWISKLSYKEQSEEFGDSVAVDSRTQLGVQRLNLNLWRPLYWGIEYRLRREQEGDNQRQGWLTEVMWDIQKHVRVGVGYNLSDFSDDVYSENDYSTHGWFVRAQGRY